MKQKYVAIAKILAVWLGILLQHGAATAQTVTVTCSDATYCVLNQQYTLGLTPVSNSFQGAQTQTQNSTTAPWYNGTATTNNAAAIYWAGLAQQTSAGPVANSTWLFGYSLSAGNVYVAYWDGTQVINSTTSGTTIRNGTNAQYAYIASAPEIDGAAASKGIFLLVSFYIYTRKRAVIDA